MAEDDLGEEIRAYIDRQDEKVRELLIEVYRTLRSALPDESERINWGMPTFGKNVIHFAAAKRHLGIYPGPEVIERFSAILDERGFKHSKGAVQMPYGKVDLGLIADMARCAQQLAEEGTDA